jgi:Membrane transport protein.
VKKIFNPPIYAAILAIPLALIPGIKEYMFTGSGSLLVNNVTNALTSMGNTVSPLINIILGSNLNEGFPPGADISW